MLNTDHLAACIVTLESSLSHLQKTSASTIDYEVFRNAVIKGFELTLETAGKLLRKALKLYRGDPRTIDALTYKEVVREGAKHGLLTEEMVQRWFEYRDNRNNTAHDYGKEFTDETIALMPAFLKDVHALQIVLTKKLSSTC